MKLCYPQQHGTSLYQVEQKQPLPLQLLGSRDDEGRTMVEIQQNRKARILKNWTLNSSPQKNMKIWRFMPFVEMEIPPLIVSCNLSNLDY